MKYLVGLAAFLTLTVLLTAAAAPVGENVPTAVNYFSHDQVAAMMAKDGSSTMVSDPGLKVGINRRGAGHVEYHDHNNHIFIVAEGEATLITGGTMINPKRTAPDQMVADSIEGGETHHLSKGDVITIPAKTPHWMKEVPTKTIVLYVVDLASQ